MSDFEQTAPRKRRRSLLIVEGNHEKNELFWLIFKCFPELDIDFEDVWIYGTNIYQLYEDIVREYGTDWEDVEVDLPFVLSRKKGYEPARIEDFINVFLVFDYERHDPNFSEEKIERMQKYFIDSTYVGKLYINYPMIESYQHLQNLSDMGYLERNVSVTLQPGERYKSLVSGETFLKTYVEFPQKMREILKYRFHVTNKQVCLSCMEAILGIDCEEALIQTLGNILNDVIEETNRKTAIYQFNDLLIRKSYLAENISYWTFMRRVLQRIIILNIFKGYKIQNQNSEIVQEKCQMYFEELNAIEILDKQNKASRDLQNGYIWVLNTCIWLVADYKFDLLLEYK